MVTDYFKSNKATSSSKTPYMKPLIEKTSREKFEEMTSHYRGDNVKILWLPPARFEFDASKFVSVFLMNEISLRLENNDDLDVQTQCVEAINRLPSKIWEMAVDYAEGCENLSSEAVISPKEDEETKEDPTS